MRRTNPLPILRCPICGFQYQATMNGWTFRTNAATPCIGNTEQDGTLDTNPYYNHPFEVVTPCSS